MEFKKEDMIDLNEQNVQRLFAYCLANNKSNPDNTFKSSFFNNETPGNIPAMSFDKTKLTEVSNRILYMLGQLHSLHSKKTDLVVTEGFKKYDGTNWSQNKVALFALYYLGTAASILPSFKYLPLSKCYASPISDFEHILKPTLSPNDPNFTE